MKVLKSSLVIGALACALSAHAQFGAVGKSDLKAVEGKSGILLNAYFLDYSVKVPGGGTAKANGFIVNAEKALEGGERFSTISAYISRLDSTNSYNFNYKTYLGEQYGVIGGVLFGDGTTGFNLYGFYDFVNDEDAKAVKFQVGGGLERFDGDSHLAAFARASYPIQNGFTLDASLLLRFVSNANATALAFGVGYKF